MLQQRTIKNPIKAVGVGLHSGKDMTLELLPAPVNTGITFVRNDLDPEIEIPAIFEYVGDTTLSTSLFKEGYKIATIEHLLSAIAGLGIDNCIIKVDGPEVPIMDGSASPFVFLIQSAGLVEQGELKKFIKVKKEVRVERGDTYAAIKPFDGFKVSFEIDFDDPTIKQHAQKSSIDFSSTSFVKEVCRARTFGSVKDMDFLQSQGLALGASVSNAIAVGDDGILNEEGLRFDDEFVKHKMLDAIGDLYLLGHNLIGQFSGFKSGHSLNNELLRKILASEDAWEVVTFEDSLSYSLGITIGTNLPTSAELNRDILIKGINDYLNNASPQINPADRQTILREFNAKNALLEKEAMQSMSAEAKELSRENKMIGQEFLENNKKKSGVIVRKRSNLQYKKIITGSGIVPDYDDIVVVHYNGYFVDGHKFDSSIDRGAPIKLELNKFIPGWQEILLMMPVGSKWEVYIPYNLAYGESGIPGQELGQYVVPPSSTLIFEMELLDIVK